MPLTEICEVVGQRWAWCDRAKFNEKYHVSFQDGDKIIPPHVPVTLCPIGTISGGEKAIGKRLILCNVVKWRKGDDGGVRLEPVLYSDLPEVDL